MKYKSLKNPDCSFLEAISCGDNDVTLTFNGVSIIHEHGKGFSIDTGVTLMSSSWDEAEALFNDMIAELRCEMEL